MPPETFLVLHSILVALCLPFNLSYPSQPFTTPLLPVTVPPQTPSLCTAALFELCSGLWSSLVPSETRPWVDLCLRELLLSPLPSRVPPCGPRPPDDICTLLRSPPDFLLVSLSLLWCLWPNQDTSVLLFSHPFGAPPFGPRSPEDICTLFSSLLSSPHPQDFFGLSGPVGISLIPVTIPLVPSEPCRKPSLCSRAVCFPS